MTIVKEQSIVEKYSYNTYEQVAFGIDYSTVQHKIRHLIRNPLLLTSQILSGNKSIGKLLHDYFQSH